MSRFSSAYSLLEARQTQEAKSALDWLEKRAAAAKP